MAKSPEISELSRTVAVEFVTATVPASKAVVSSVRLPLSVIGAVCVMAPPVVSDTAEVPALSIIPATLSTVPITKAVEVLKFNPALLVRLAANVPMLFAALNVAPVAALSDSTAKLVAVMGSLAFWVIEPPFRCNIAKPVRLSVPAPSPRLIAIGAAILRLWLLPVTPPFSDIVPAPVANRFTSAPSVTPPV